MQMNNTPPLAEPRYMNPYLAGTLLGLLLFGTILLTGHGLGASGGMAKLVAAGTDKISPATVDQCGYLASLARPGSNPLNHWVVWGLLGSLMGAFVSGLIMKRVKPEVHKGPRINVPVRFIAAFIGGAFMGYGSQWARGCTSGQALSGGATLSAGSWALMFAIFGGAYALAYPLRRLWK